MCERCKNGDHSKHEPFWGGICVGCACPVVDFTPRPRDAKEQS